jgi:hypothetical protein
MKNSYDQWVEDQLQHHTRNTFSRFGNNAAAMSFDSNAQDMPSPQLDTALIPSDLFTPRRTSLPHDDSDLASIVHALASKIAGLETQNAQLRGHVQRVCQQHAASVIANPGTNQLQNQLSKVQQQIDALQVSQTALSQSQSDLKDSQNGDASKNDVDLINLTFTAKFALIEKVLGIDITTTGPKPGNLLELIHNRLWHLESTLLPPGAPYYHGNQPYRSLTEFVRPSSSAVHRTATYEIPSNYKAPQFPFVVNNGVTYQHPALPPNAIFHGNIVQPGATGPHLQPPPPCFPIPKPKFEPQDVRYQHPQPPRPNRPHPLQYDPSIPKGPKAKASDIQGSIGSRPSSTASLALVHGPSRPKSTDSRKSSDGYRKQGTNKRAKDDLIQRPRSVPYQQSAQYLHPGSYQQIDQHSQPVQNLKPVQPVQSAPSVQLPQYQQTLEQPSLTKSDRQVASLKAFMQVPGGFEAPPMRKNGMCEDESCEFC